MEAETSPLSRNRRNPPRFAEAVLGTLKKDQPSQIMDSSTAGGDSGGDKKGCPRTAMSLMKELKAEKDRIQLEILKYNESIEEGILDAHAVDVPITYLKPEAICNDQEPSYMDNKFEGQAEKGLLDAHLVDVPITPDLIQPQGCGGCGLIYPCKTLKKVKGPSGEAQQLCNHCTKQYCGICKKIWNHLDCGDWICCDGCDVWVHIHCANISGCSLEDLKSIAYYCPDCREKIIVVCNGMEGTYLPKLHLITCNCGSGPCASKKQTPCEWERHTGCRAKNWKSTVKVKNKMQTLEKWITWYNEHGLDMKMLADFLKAEYEPVPGKWTTERCGICRWAEDWDHNKIIICSRCQIAVHQECYGAKNVEEDFMSWVCRACESYLDVKKNCCCLCPVEGGALKPTDIATFWVHVTCAWFRPEVAFLNHDKMEPATGILNIPPNSFLKRCSICEQTHGSCTQCCKCATYFHVMCAARAGYSMELHCLHNKDGRQITNKLIYCAVHRIPKPDSVLVLHSPSGVFSPTNMVQTSADIAEPPPN